MAFVSLRQLLDHAAEHGYGVPAKDAQAPVILQASAGARKYAGEAYLRHVVLAAVESHPRHSRRAAPGPRRDAGGLPGSAPDSPA